MSAEPLTVEYDEQRDILTIDGFRYAGEMFRNYLHKPTPEGIWLRVIGTDDGVVTGVQQLASHQPRAGGAAAFSRFER